MPGRFSDDSVTPWTAARQAPLSTGLSRQEDWSGLPCPPPGGFPDPGVKPRSLASPALAGGFLPLALPGKPKTGLQIDLLNAGICAGHHPPPDVSHNAGFSPFPMASLCCPSGFRPHFRASSSCSGPAPGPPVTLASAPSHRLLPPRREAPSFLPCSNSQAPLVLTHHLLLSRWSKFKFPPPLIHALEKQGFVSSEPI